MRAQGIFTTVVYCSVKQKQKSNGTHEKKRAKNKKNGVYRWTPPPPLPISGDRFWRLFNNRNRNRNKNKQKTRVAWLVFVSCLYRILRQITYTVSPGPTVFKSPMHIHINISAAKAKCQCPKRVVALERKVSRRELSYPKKEQRRLVGTHPLRCGGSNRAFEKNKIAPRGGVISSATIRHFSRSSSRHLLQRVPYPCLDRSRENFFFRKTERKK